MLLPETKKAMAVSVGKRGLILAQHAPSGKENGERWGGREKYCEKTEKQVN